MRKYLARRALFALGTLVGVSLIIFVVLRILPGDPLVAILGVEGHARMTPADRVRIVLALLFWFGYKAPLIIVHFWESPWQNLQIVIGPAIVLGLAQGAYIARMSRSCLLEVIGEDYVRTARAKGLREGLVVMRHALPNALLPV